MYSTEEVYKIYKVINNILNKPQDKAWKRISDACWLCQHNMDKLAKEMNRHSVKDMYINNASHNDEIKQLKREKEEAYAEGIKSAERYFRVELLKVKNIVDNMLEEMNKS